MRKIFKNISKSVFRLRNVGINRANGSHVYECCRTWTLVEVERMGEKNPQKPSISSHLKEYSRSRPRLFLFPVSFLPRRDSLRHVPTSNQHLLGLHPALWSIAIPTPSESARLLPGLSRLGQYRKRLTCTLTRIHVEPRVRHLSINTLRYSDGHWPVTQTVYRYSNAVCHQSAFDYDCAVVKSVLLSSILDAC